MSHAYPFLSFIVKPFLAVFLIMIFLCGCSTHQRLDNSLLISPGMTKQQVLGVMGDKPIRNEFSRSVHEWHYCSTGQYADAFIVVFFSEGKVIAMRPYTVTSRDAKGAAGSCELFVKMGNYREPEEVRELRVNFY